MSENFETFLRFWIAENIRPLAPTESSDDVARSRAKELEGAATTAGFYGELDEAVRPYGSIEGLVRDKIQTGEQTRLAQKFGAASASSPRGFSRADSRCKIK